MGCGLLAEGNHVTQLKLHGHATPIEPVQQQGVGDGSGTGRIGQWIRQGSMISC